MLRSLRSYGRSQNLTSSAFSSVPARALFEPLEARRMLSLMPTPPSGEVGVTQNAAAFSLIHLDDFYADPRFTDIDGRDVSVAVLDTGADLNHPFFGPDSNADGLADRIVYHFDFADTDANASDFSGHGSNIASLIGSQDSAYPGVAQRVNLIVLKVFPSNGGVAQESKVRAALQWIKNNASTYNIVATNLSFGFGRYENISNGAYASELASLAGAGILPITSGGNDFYSSGSTAGVSYPAADPNALAVGAVWSANSGGPFAFGDGAVDVSTGADRIVSFTSRDPMLLDVMAPGALLAGADEAGGVGVGTGSSQAAAVVTGVAALMQQLALRELGRLLSFQEFGQLIHSTGQTINDGDDEEDNVSNTDLNFQRIDVMELAEGVLGLRPPPADVRVVGAGNPIADGDTLPTAGDGSNFGQALQNSAAPQRVFTVTNTGGQALQIGPVLAGGGFDVVQSLPASLAPGASATLVLQMSTASVGEKSATVRFLTNAPLVGEFDFAVSGTVVIPPAPDINVLAGAVPIADGTTTPVSFGTATLGTGGATRTFIVRNDGTQTLSLPSFFIPDSFVVLDSIVTSLAPGQSDSFVLQLQSTALGTFGGDVIINTNDPDEASFNFSIVGQVVAPLLPDISVRLGSAELVSADPTQIDFGQSLQGTPAPSLTFTLVNTGTASLTLGAVSVPGGFALVQSPGTTLAAGQSAQMILAMTTSELGLHTGTILISSDDPDENPFAFQARGIVTIALTPEITVLEESILTDGQETVVDFGSIPQNSAGVTKTFTVRNEGDSILTLGAVLLPGGFTLLDPLLPALNPGEADAFVVRLDPGALGQRTGTLRFNSNDVDEGEFEFTITGTVTPPLEALAEISIDGLTITDGQIVPINFGSVPRGEAQPVRSFAIRNTGTATLTIDPLSLPQGFELGDAPPTALEPGQSAIFTLRMTTANAGPRSGRVEMPSNDTSQNPFDFAITGVVTATSAAITVLDDQGKFAILSEVIDLGTIVGSVGTSSRTFFVRNDGNSPLTLNLPPAVAGFVVDRSLLPATLLAGQSSSFTISLDPARPGAFADTLNLSSNDPTRGVVEFSMQGNVTPPPGAYVQSIDLRSVPTRVVGSSGRSAQVDVKIVNNGTSRVKGRTLLKVFASRDTRVDMSSDLELGKASPKIDLKPGASKTIRVNVRFGTPPTDGDYLMLAALSGAGVSGTSPTNVANRPVFIERPKVELVPVVGALPQAARVNKASKLQVRFGNEGNSRAQGRYDAEVLFFAGETDNPANVIWQTLLRRLKLDIKQGENGLLSISIKLPKSFAPGTYNAIVRLKLDSNLSQLSDSPTIDMPVTVTAS